MDACHLKVYVCSNFTLEPALLSDLISQLLLEASARVNYQLTEHPKGNMQDARMPTGLLGQKKLQRGEIT